MVIHYLKIKQIDVIQLKGYNGKSIQDFAKLECAVFKFCILLECFTEKCQVKVKFFLHKHILSQRPLIMV